VTRILRLAPVTRPHIQLRWIGLEHTKPKKKRHVKKEEGNGILPQYSLFLFLFLFLFLLLSHHSKCNASMVLLIN
jgi:hypothetical protein